MLADEVRVLAIVPPAPISSRKKNQPKSQTRSRNPGPSSSPPTNDAKAKFREERRKTGSCFECGESGHTAWRCPHRALVATEAEAIVEDELDEDALYAAQVQYGMVSAPGQRAMMTCDRVLFSPSEVIFDNAASTLVFVNPDLLSHIVPSAAPTIVGGVQKGAPGVRIDDVGTFRDLGQVGIGKGASCNILSACQMVDTGRSFSYDNDKDEFVVAGSDQEYRIG